MIKVVLVGKEKKVELVDLIKEEIKEEDELLEREVETKTGKYVVYMYEKFYLRINSNLSVTIFYEEIGEDSRIELISSGGSTGLLMTSYGAEEKSLEALTEKLVALGYTVEQ